MVASRSVHSATAPAPRNNRGLAPAHKAMFYVSRKLAATANGAGAVKVDVSLGSDPEELAKFNEAFKAWIAKSSDTGLVKPLVFIDVMHKAATDLLNKWLADELTGMVEAYRTFLRESLAKGDDPTVKAALNRARLQEKILAGTPMVDQAEACELLGLSSANPSATMKRKEERGEVLRFSIDGRAAYPLLQFDVEGRRVLPAMIRLMANKPKAWSDFRLLHWLIRPHLDFEHTPGEALGSDGEGVIAAFAREIEPPVHG